MQIAILNIVTLGLLAFLFGIIASMRPDDRLRCWEAGWICVLARFVCDLWQPHELLWVHIRSCISMDLFALAAIFFLVSTMVRSEGRKAGLQLGSLIAVSTLLCISLAILVPQATGLLIVLVLARQALAIFLAARDRPNRAPVSCIVVAVCLIACGWMLYGLTHGYPPAVVQALIAELYLVVAIDFRFNNWPRSIALTTTCLGLVAWSFAFPLLLLVERFWPGFVIELQILSLPKICVAVGMMLVVLEEDTRVALELGKEYRLLFESNPHPLWVFEQGSMQILDVNQAALDLHGYTREEFLALKLTDLLDPAMVPQVIAEAKLENPRRNRASRHLRKDGTLLPLDIDAYSILFKGKPCRFVLGIDVTEREALAHQLAHQARHDALTGLPNRLLFQERLGAAAERAVRGQMMLAVICLDVIRLKAINDSYGIRVGDECIQRMAKQLRERVAGVDDIVARTGGGEFALILSSVKSAAAVEQAVKEMRAAFAQPLLVQGYKIQLSLSMGLVMCPDDGTDATTLWRRAESARRQSRTANNGETVWFSPELNRVADEQIELEAYMRTQLEEGGFYLHYQPLYSFDGTLHGLEALLRLQHPKYGAVSPARFIPIAEETGMIGEIGYWVLEEVCRQLRCWSEAGARLVPVAANVSGMQLMHVDFAGRVLGILKRFGIDPKWIHLEVTETAAMQNVSEVAERMAALANEGIQFSIDDFGTGHSSLGRLHQLPISVLKIDRSFVDQLCLHNGTYSIVQAIISMAHALGHQVVAEGVEQPSQLVCLHTLQCDLLQGFLLSRPVPPERIPELAAHSLPLLFEVLDSAQSGESEWVL